MKGKGGTGKGGGKAPKGMKHPELYGRVETGKGGPKGGPVKGGKGGCKGGK